MNACEHALVNVLSEQPNHTMLWEVLKTHLIAQGFSLDQAIDASIRLEDKNIVSEISIFVHASGGLQDVLKLNIIEFMGQELVNML